MNRFCLPALGLCLAVRLAAAPPAGEETAVFPLALDLATARELCLRHNPQLHQLRAQVEEQAGRLTELHAAGRPTLDLGASYTTFEERRQQSFGTFAPDTYRWGADLEGGLTVYSGGRNRLAVESQEASRRAVQADLAAAAQDILNQVYATYFQALLARETAEVQRDAIRVLEEQLRYASSRVAAGVVDRFEVMQAEVSLANSRPPLVRAENDYRRAIESLRVLVGLPLPPEHESMDVQLQEPALPAWEEDLTFAEALERASLHRPELQAVAERRDAQVRQLEIAERGRSPVVSLFAGYGVESDQFGDEDYLRGWTAGVVATWALVDGGVTRGRTDQQSARLQQLEHQRAELVLAIGNEVRQALYDYQESRIILDTADQVIAQAEEALRLSRNRYEAGRGTQLDVLESHLQLTRARLERATAHRTLQRAQIDLLRATGETL